jgi:hypothetical protein
VRCPGAARAAASLAPHTLTELSAPGDTQGALALLPAFQAGLLLALGMTAFPGWRRLVPAFGLLLAPRSCCSWSWERWPTTRTSFPTRFSCGPGPWASPVVLMLAMLRAETAAAAAAA